MERRAGVAEDKWQKGEVVVKRDADVGGGAVIAEG